ncbi:MAG TPA: ABC transporter permease [Conexibacter sp.]|nr:ABC transporter permease [Conexibacter sp.]
MPDVDTTAIATVGLGVGPDEAQDAGDVEPGTGRRLLSVLRKRPGAIVGALGLTAITLIAVLAPVLAPYDIHEQSGAVYAHPSSAHLLGLSDQGIDVVSQLMWACRISLLVGFAAAVVSIVIGGAVGIVAGYFGGRVDLVLALITDYFIVVPALPVLIVAAAVWGPSLPHIIIILGLLLWTTPARLIRAQTKSLRERTYVRRARSLGAGHLHVILRHVVPHTAPLLIANAILAVSAAIFAETALSFLGLGDASQVSLGVLIENAYNHGAATVNAWWVLYPPGILVMVIVMCATLVGLAVEDVLNPRSRHVPVGWRLLMARRIPLRGEDPAEDPAAELEEERG